MFHRHPLVYNYHPFYTIPIAIKLIDSATEQHTHVFAILFGYHLLQKNIVNECRLNWNLHLNPTDLYVSRETYVTRAIKMINLQLKINSHISGPRIQRIIFWPLNRLIGQQQHQTQDGVGKRNSKSLFCV